MVSPCTFPQLDFSPCDSSFTTCFEPRQPRKSVADCHRGAYVRPCTVVQKTVLSSILSHTRMPKRVLVQQVTSNATCEALVFLYRVRFKYIYRTSIRVFGIGTAGGSFAYRDSKKA